MSVILAINSTTTEVVLSERVVSNEFKVIEIQESIQNRMVRVDIELGPFVTEERGNETFTRGSSRRGLTVWANEEYDAIRDSWQNADLLAKILTLI